MDALSAVDVRAAGSCGRFGYQQRSGRVWLFADNATMEV
jgi:hypothetical protein